MQILKRDLIKKSEESAVSCGAFSFRDLMATAGKKASEIICDKIDPKNKKVAVLCGKGNNGGDGFVIADCLYGRGADVTVITPFGASETEDAKYYFGKLNFIKITDFFDPDGDYDIIIDALFGIGFNRMPTIEVTELFDKINSAAAYKIAIDIPSGVDCDNGKVYTSAVKADLTVTFIALKPCFLLPDGSDYCGEVVVADIGVAPVGHSFLTTEKPIFPKRRRNSHKGSYGTALIICGSYGMAGAAILSTKAALRSGLGIAKCLVCDGIYCPFTVSIPEAVCIPVKQTESGTLPSDLPDFERLYDNCTAVLFGCGVGKGHDVDALLEKVLQSNLPTVIDADGINALANRIDILKETAAPIILTPHPGEMARLCKITPAEVEADRIGIAKAFALKYGCVLVLKGANTVIATPDGEVVFNMTGNPGLATGGSGDLLAGIIVSLLAQGFALNDAAKAAVYLHGEAADEVAAKKGERALLPSDVIDQL